ncbi:Major facilitator superfamily domain, general substrate transporter [Pseudocohnilembus persalinus]|uniref:Major facilitator superfamily domain, general substrate transporter n=1 Tax=Pseudocohnilembus persalinus TaxID=266149 RepID=A0A0V0QTK4_PSEPJ|nr:Major facilitator superfamily domain, general substrate transporter [Pseudocohnilembus persalinus]|eukprot:KRX05515.1 Major facilitator superfamily domain, general substrate transporter [Pseudocohnilembus persalinus]
MQRKQLTPTEVKEIKQQSWRIIVGGILLNLIVGSFYSFGAYSIYLASYLKTQTPNLTLDGIAIVFPLMNILMNCTPIYGLMYTLPFLSTWRYFPTKLQKVNAVLQTGFGLGGAIFGYFAFEIVNYDNQAAKYIVEENGVDRFYFEECISFNVPTMLKTFSISIAILGALTLILLWKPSNENLDHYRDLMIRIDNKKKSDKEKEMMPTSECLNLKQGLLSKNFQLLFIMAFASTMFGFFIMTQYKNYGILLQYDDQTLTYIGFLAFTLFGCTRDLWTKLITNQGFKKSFIYLQSSILVLMILYMKYCDNLLIYGLTVVIIIFLQGGLFTWFSSFTPKVFGYNPRWE